MANIFRQLRKGIEDYFFAGDIQTQYLHLSNLNRERILDSNDLASALDYDKKYRNRYAILTSLVPNLMDCLIIGVFYRSDSGFPWPLLPVEGFRLFSKYMAKQFFREAKSFCEWNIRDCDEHQKFMEQLDRRDREGEEWKNNV
jgi:hypothetical protein